MTGPVTEVPAELADKMSEFTAKLLQKDLLWSPMQHAQIRQGADPLSLIASDKLAIYAKRFGYPELMPYLHEGSVKQKRRFNREPAS